MTRKTHRIRQITIETHSVTIIRAKGNPNAIYGDFCQMKAAAFTPGQAAGSFQMTLAEICRRLETGELHLIGNGRGTAFICAGRPVRKIPKIERLCLALNILTKFNLKKGRY